MEDTIDYIVTNKCSCSRYGDGEFAIINGSHNNFQKEDELLSKRLKEVLLSPLENHLLCIPSFITNVKPFVLNSKLTGLGFNYTLLKPAVMPYVATNKTYGDSLFTRFYMSQKDKSKTSDYIQKLKRIWDGEELLIVEGTYSRLGVGNDLFDKAKSIKRILCPNNNAFDKYDKILQCILNHHDKELIILALGMTATILAYDLSKLGKRALDLGHIDVEYEWFKIGAVQKVKISGKQVSEVLEGNCDEASQISDTKYASQIIAHCS